MLVLCKEEHAQLLTADSY